MAMTFLEEISSQGWFFWYVALGIPVWVVALVYAMHYFLDRPPRR
jgi:hypothetical protein